MLLKIPNMAQRWPKRALGGPKTAPRAPRRPQEPSKTVPRDLKKTGRNRPFSSLAGKSLQDPPKSLPKDVQEPSRGICHLTWEPLELKVPGVRCQVSGAREGCLMSMSLHFNLLTSSGMPPPLQVQLLITSDKTVTTKE